MVVEWDLEQFSTEAQRGHRPGQSKSKGSGKDFTQEKVVKYLMCLEYTEGDLYGCGKENQAKK